ncbi:MAG: sugar transferase [Bacteroidales bacterium]|jgi:exopolysaccharide biosynthesis polyprenyl glycosylphosphotransferase|nr:sugar transferase [Bacteroidales bacterium]MDD2569483.1 sugar transferase [Bacteroidales bacterium]MDD2812782.1 sugar transferase [Bacteroidales bacterium]MDD3384549.1 sugar transferase [Bacteroidales bacterium]MDD3811198.1 sugar transferase [Bacteroidales bacterium]
MNRKRQLTKYISADLLSAALAWTLFYIFRKVYIESKKFGYPIPVEFDTSFFLALLFLPLVWVLFYYTTGYYKDLFRKSRLSELGQTIATSFIGALVIFFALILDDTVKTYTNYYLSFLVIFLLQFFLTYIPRLIFTTNAAHRIQNRIYGFPTLLIGSGKRAESLFLEMENQPRSTGNQFVGFISVMNHEKYLMEKHLPHLGTLRDLKNLLTNQKIEEVILAIESSEHDLLKKIISKLEYRNITIKVIPDMYDILTGMVKMTSIIGTPLIQISHDLMPPWEHNLKRIMDVGVSLVALVLLLPIYLILAIGVKLSSPGPIFYSHERIGRYGKPFMIYKFRSMYQDAEKDGPALSSQDDSRITSFGKFMRKTRMDELPQFFNVLIGDMSLVGPRPERQHFIDQIVKKAPHFNHLQKVRPGITSWGQVKFGYASNVDEMIERLKYDILYIENMSLLVDMKILIYTIKTILKASGK